MRVNCGTIYAEMRIGLVIPRFSAGGAEQVVLALAKEFRALGHEVTIVSIGSGGNMVPVFNKSGVDLVELGIQRQFRMSPFWLIDVIKSRNRIIGCLAEKRFDVVHTHLMGTDIDCLYAAKRAGVKAVVHTIHNVYEQYHRKNGMERVRNWRRRIAYAKYNHIYAVDDEVQAWAIKCGIVTPDHITTIRNGVNFSRLNISSSKEELRRRYDFKEGQIIALNVGSLTKQKNHVNLIMAMKTVVKGYPTVRLLIAGGGPLKDALQKKITEAGLGQVVELLGYRDDIPSLMKASDLFVFPSLWEGLPIALLEALATGLPAIVSDIPVHRKILDSGNIGWLIPTEDFEAVAGGILAALGSMGSSGKHLYGQRMVLESYSSKSMAEKYLASYIEILKKKGHHDS